MSKISCSNCGKLNSAYIRWCLDCGSYCNDDFDAPPSVNRAIEDLFESSMKLRQDNKNSTGESSHYAFNFVPLSARTDFSSISLEDDETLPTDRSCLSFTTESSLPEDQDKISNSIVSPKCPKPIYHKTPKISSSFRNPYYPNKADLENFMRSSMSVWESTEFKNPIYQSMSLQQLSVQTDSSLVDNLLDGNADSLCTLTSISEHCSPQFVEQNNSFINNSCVFGNGEEVDDGEFDTCESDSKTVISCGETKLFDVEPLPLKTFECSDYDELFQITPRIQRGDESFLLCLPPELLLYILSLLDSTSLVNTQYVCKKIRRFSRDPSLWQSVTLRNKQVKDDWLHSIAMLKPADLGFVCCDGESLSSAALAEMFRYLSGTLISFTLRASSRGALDSDNVILRLANQCGQHITRLSLAWSSITDTGLVVLKSSLTSLKHLDLAGCQAISDEGLSTLIVARGHQLETLILCQSSKFTSLTFESISQHCHNLRHLEMISIPALTDLELDAIITSSRDYLEMLSFEHCRSLTDVSVFAICEMCSHLKSLNISKNQQLSAHSIHVISEQLKKLHHLNLSRIQNIHDADLIFLSSLSQLRSIDLSFLLEISSESVAELLDKIPSLLSINLTGCSKVIAENRDFSDIICQRSLTIVI